MEPVALSGKVALITGGGTGIGHAIAVDLAGRGVRCALVGRRQDILAEAVEALPSPAVAIAADITDVEAPGSIITTTNNRMGPIDIVVHAAGTFAKSPLEETSVELWETTIDLNLTAVLRLTQAAWPDLRSTSGQILMISSIAARRAFEGNAAYAASKGGLNALADVIALEGKEHGIRVITLLPAQTATPLWDEKAPPDVIARMMPASAIGSLAGDLLASDRSLDFSPMVVEPPSNPWHAPEA